MPEEILDYVVVHELAHRLQMNHSTEFWDEVEKILPDYRKRRQWLKENGQSAKRERNDAEKERNLDASDKTGRF